MKYPFLLFWISINILIYIASTPASQIFFRDFFNQKSADLLGKRDQLLVGEALEVSRRRDLL